MWLCKLKLFYQRKDAASLYRFFVFVAEFDHESSCGENYTVGFYNVGKQNQLFEDFVDVTKFMDYHYCTIKLLSQTF